MFKKTIDRPITACICLPWRHGAWQQVGWQLI